MVTTRRGVRTLATEDEDSSPGDSDIPAQIVSRRGPATGSPMSLRPLRESSSGVKRKRDGSVGNKRPGKHPKRRPMAKDAVEDETQVNGALLDMLDQPTSNIIVAIPNFRRPRGNSEVTSTTNFSSETQSARSGRRFRAKRIKRGVNSLEVFEEVGSTRLQRIARGNGGPDTIRETPQPQSRPGSVQHEDHVTEEVEEVPSDVEPSDQRVGSPELQSSALKRRPERPTVDIYDVPVSEPPTPHFPRRPTTRSNSRQSSRAMTAKKAGPKPPFSRKGARLSSILEEEQMRPATPPPPRPVARQVVARNTDRRAALQVISHEDGDSVEDGSGLSEVEETEFEEEEEQEEGEESENSDSGADQQADALIRARGPANQESVNIHIHPYSETQRTITVISDHINQLLLVMGSGGWTDAGERWDADLLSDNTLDFGGEVPALTKLGRGCFKSLSYLKDKLDEVPDALDLSRQSRFLAEEEQALNRTMTSVDKVVTKIFDDALAIPSDSENNTNRRFRDAVVKDLLSCLIPMLVLVLRSCFALGVTEYDGKDGEPLPKEGIFTGATVQYMLRITSWLLQLEKPLTLELSQRGRASDAPNASQTASQEQALKHRKRDREKSSVMLRKWKEQLRRAVDGFNEQADQDQDRLQKKQRDLAIKEAKREAEEQKLALAAKKDEAWQSSLQQILKQPPPLAEKWLKAIQHWTSAPPPSSGELNDGRNVRRSIPSSGTQTLSGPLSSSSSRSTLALAHHPTQRPAAVAAQRPKPTLPPLVLDYEPWPADETEWFLMELARPDRRRGYLEVCAETLDHPLGEVRKEKERLKRLGRYHSPSPVA